MSTDLRAQLHTALGDAYAIERELGGGGMSRVFVAEETKLKRKVVVKVLPPDIAGAISVERFTREIQVAARLQHPHIVPLLAAGEAGGVPFYTMPLIQGESLRQRLVRDSRLPASEAVRVCLEVADALGYAHAQGVVHRDIKPDNILLSGDHALVLDFGIAKAIDASKTSTHGAITATGVSIGTPVYMSPEQAAGESHVDERSDIYSLGAVLYEMLSGRQPFTGATAAQVLAARFRDRPVALRAIDAGIPIGIEKAVECAMAMSPDDRYRTAGAFLDALRGTGERAATSHQAPAASHEKSIAVLPFANMSADGDSEYFSDGITEEIINAIVQLPGLRVAARTSSFAFKGKNMDIGEIGAKLKVNTVLEGSVRRAGKKLRITAQLINVSDGFHIWSDKYDRDMDDIFAVQDEISRAIADQLKVRLSAADQQSPLRPSAKNPEAYDLYLKGRYFWQKRGKYIRSAVECFTKAIELDPEFALPVAGLSAAYSTLALYGAISGREAYDKGRSLAYRALELDDSLGESHLAVAIHETWQGWDLEKCGYHFGRSVELRPDSGVSRSYYAVFLGNMGHESESIAMARSACEAEPLNPLVVGMASVSCSFVGDGAAALPLAERAVELDAGFVVGHWALSWAQQLCGRLPEAIVSMERAVECSDQSSTLRSFLASQYALAGRTDEARAIVADLAAAGRIAGFGSGAVALTALGERDAAYELFVKAIADRTCGPQLAPFAPGGEPLLRDPRVRQALRDAGLRQTADYLDRRAARSSSTDR